MNLYDLRGNFSQAAPQLNMYYNTHEVLPPFNCEAKLVNSDLWKEFHKLGTEMIITKGGRCMFPILAIRLEGLEVDEMYAVSIEMHSIGGGRWTRSKGHWSPTSAPALKSISELVTAEITHPFSPATCSIWSRPFKFTNIKLTNSYESESHILLKSMHKYQPVLIVRRLGNSPAEKRFVFAETEFVAVTAYQNPDIARLKIDYNPYARGFRHGERRKRSLKTQEKNDNIPSPQSQPLDCSISSPSSSSSESCRSSPPLEVHICDSPTQITEPNNIPIANPFNAINAEDWYTMMGDWNRNIIYGNYANYLQSPSFHLLPPPQWHMPPKWHVPESHVYNNNNNITRPKGSSFTIRAILEKN